MILPSDEIQIVGRSQLSNAVRDRVGAGWCIGDVTQTLVGDFTIAWRADPVPYETKAAINLRTKKPR
jgi:hypothetical protein